MMLDIFRPELDKDCDDGLIGLAVADRYRVLQLWLDDDFSRLYIGLDITDDSIVGIRVALSPRRHGRMLEWLAQVMLTNGKHAILAIGHLNQDKTMYVVLSEAALDIVRRPPSVVRIPVGPDSKAV